MYNQPLSRIQWLDTAFNESFQSMCQPENRYGSNITYCPVAWREGRGLIFHKHEWWLLLHGVWPRNVVRVRMCVCVCVWSGQGWKMTRTQYRT